MGKQRHQQKLKAANDPHKKPVALDFPTIVFAAPTPRTVGRFAASTVLLLFVGLTTLAVFEGREQTLSAPQPQETRKVIKSVAAPLPKILQIPASRLLPNTPLADDETVNIVAAKISELPALHKNKTVHVVVENEETITDSLVRAHEFLESGELGEALDTYNKILAADAQNHDALAGKTYLLAKTGYGDQAISVGREWVELYPTDTKAKTNLAHILAQTGQINEAILLLDQAARQEPHNIKLQLELATFYDRAGHAPQALMLYKQILYQAENGIDANLPLPRIEDRISYLEKSTGVAEAPEPSTTLPVDN